MKIVHKIGLVGMVPIVALCAVVVAVLSPRVTLLKDAGRWEDTSRLVADCSHFIHDLQIERGTSATYIKGGISRSTLEEKRKATDDQHEQFLANVDEHAFSDKVAADLKANAARVGELRRLVDAGATAGEVVAAYTAVVDGFIDYQRVILKQKTGKGQGKRLITLVTLELVKENAGLLRAGLASTCAANEPIGPTAVESLAGLRYGVIKGLETPGLTVTPGNAKKLEELKASPAWAQVEVIYQTVMARSDSGNYGYDGGQVFAIATQYVDDLGTILMDQHEKVDQRAQNIIKGAKLDIWVWSLILAISLTVSTWLLIYFARDITTPLKEAVNFSLAVAAGDLSQRLRKRNNDETGQMVEALNGAIDSLEEKSRAAERIAQKDLTVQVPMASEKDTLGLSLQGMVDSLKDLISEARENTSQVSRGAEEIASASQSLSSGTTHQAATLQQISSSMAEMNSRTQENAEHAGQAKDLTDKAATDSQAGIGDMEEMVRSMEIINESSQRIGQIIKTVDDIAFQTNLLALNAAVEAARAGKHGKGFAVVAEEVRSLAGRSAKAARETSHLIEESYTKVEQGGELATRAADSFRNIVQGVTRAADLVGEITAAVQDQARGIGEVSEGLRQVDGVVQQSTASAEELAASAEQLSSQSTLLEQRMQQFRTDDGGYAAFDRPGGALAREETFEEELILS